MLAEVARVCQDNFAKLQVLNQRIDGQMDLPQVLHCMAAAMSGPVRLTDYRFFVQGLLGHPSIDTETPETSS
jgi:hypothetical protein